MTFRTRVKARSRRFRKDLLTATARQRRQIRVFRGTAAEAALNWVLSHRSRVKAFRTAVKGTPVATAMDRLLKLIKSEARSPRRHVRRRRPVAARPTAVEKM